MKYTYKVFSSSVLTDAEPKLISMMMTSKGARGVFTLLKYDAICSMPSVKRAAFDKNIFGDFFH